MLQNLKSHTGLYETFVYREKVFNLRLLASGIPFTALTKIASAQFTPDVIISDVYERALESIHHNVRGRTTIIISYKHSFFGVHGQAKTADTLWIYEPGKTGIRLVVDELSPFYAVPSNMDCVLVCSG